MGFPAGLPKTMAVDLTDVLNTRDPRVRIETNMRIYWDRARVMIGGEDLALGVRRLAPAAATLADGGFPVEVTPDGAKPKAYDPATVEPFRFWKAHVGAYTAFGDVRAQLTSIDDAFVTTRNGDEIVLAFDAPPAPRAGSTRSYFLFADGFGKDMDPNSAVAETVGPIPFHGMPYYPYGPEVTPPSRDFSADTRRVQPSQHGLPGAVPQAYVAATR